MPQKFCTLSCIEAFSMDRLPQSGVWQLWKMHGVFPLETDVHSVLISRCSHRPSLRLRSARTDAEVVEHDRSCECEMLMAVALNNWSDVFYSCHVFFLRLKISGCSWIIHEHKIICIIPVQHFRFAQKRLWNKMNSLKLTKLNCMGCIVFEGIFMQLLCTWVFKRIVHLKMYIWLKYTDPQAVQDVDEFVSSSKPIWRKSALHHLLTNGSSSVNGCRQDESSLPIILLSLGKKSFHLNQERNLHRSSTVYKWN